MHEALTWRWCRFEELSGNDVYEVLRLRQRVFVVEQKCAYLDADGRDRQAHHLLGEREGVLCAYARVFAPGEERAYASIGRVLTDPDRRRSGYGLALMSEAIRRAELLAPRAPIKVAAQAYLRKFYGALGFEPISAEYLEDDIPHVDMMREPAKSA